MLRSSILVFLLGSILSVSAQRVYFKHVSKSHNAPIGGKKGVEHIINNEMVYPLEDIQKEVDGTVSIQYQLLPSGVPAKIKMTKNASPTLDQEAMRLFKKIQFPKNKFRPTFDNQFDEITFAFARKDWVKVYKKRGYKEIIYPHEPIDSSEKVYFYNEIPEDKPFARFDKKENYKNYMEFIAAKMQFPEEAKRIGIKGQVVISYIIEQSGRISNIEIKKEVPGGCTQEALRLIKMITWFPGIVDEKAVRTQMVSSIGFGVNSRPFYGEFNAGGSGG